jgi:DHA1 family bicyclomycin/chloramphenicol resistance-like MFS transporter
LNRATAAPGLPVLLALITALGPFSIDAYLPSFPDIGASLAATPLEVQQTLPAYLIPFAAMMLWHGAISDACGRRPVILVGLVCYALATLGALFATSIEQLWIARGAQGVSAGVGMVVGRAVIRDLHEGAAAQRLMARVGMMFALAPAVGPIIGGLLQEAYGWRSVFGFLLAFSLLLVGACWRWLPESLPPARRHPLHPTTLAAATAGILRDRPFVLTCAAFALNFSGLFVYVLSSPVFLIEHLGLDGAQFAWLFIPLTTGMIAGSALSGRLAGALSPVRTIAIAYRAMGLAVGANLGINLTAPQAFVWYLLPLPFYSAGMALAMPSLTLIAIDRFPDRRGLAAAVQGLINTGFAALAAGLFVPLLWGSPLTLALGMAVLLGAGMTACRLAAVR